ncbi:DUF4256 domain-containing protein, partial [Micrococcus sp. SIMBA_144]
MGMSNPNKSTERKNLLPEHKEELLRKLKERFEKHMQRHNDLEWAGVRSKLEENPDKRWTLNEMEMTRGEPAVVGYLQESYEYVV